MRNVWALAKPLMCWRRQHHRTYRTKGPCCVAWGRGRSPPDLLVPGSTLPRHARLPQRVIAALTNHFSPYDGPIEVDAVGHERVGGAHGPEERLQYIAQKECPPALPTG